MLKSIAVIFAVSLTSSAWALTPAPLQQQNETIIQIREACGAGLHRVNGVCVRTPARRQASRAARGACGPNGCAGGPSSLVGGSDTGTYRP
jgi:hypothetical protein